MKLTEVRISNYRSITDSTTVEISQDITVLVGKNESGKTAFLSGLHKTRSAESATRYDYVNDYPRRKLTKYELRHEDKPDQVAELHYLIDDADVAEVSNDLGIDIVGRSLITNHLYNNAYTLRFSVDEPKYVKHIQTTWGFSADAISHISNCQSIKKVVEALEQIDLNSSDQTLLEKLNSLFIRECPDSWDSALKSYVWRRHLRERQPYFLYFDEYRLLPGKVNLQALSRRVHEGRLTESDQTVIGLLNLASVPLDNIVQSDSYEQSQARLEGLSNSITDTIFDFWTQNEDLEVLFTIAEDPNESSPYNHGPNLYIRIRSTRHRVSVPFDQRSRGFRWFFSFLVWFDSAREHAGLTTEPVLLLDEPGLSLHALAQADLLGYLKNLAQRNQIIYTTHSPFMVDNNKLESVRCVQDNRKNGTVVSADFTLQDRSTLFPLQAALGYSIAQNLFISRKNILVEGISDLYYLNYFSQQIDEASNYCQDTTVLPAGGLGRLASFVSLLSGNDLSIVVVHDSTMSGIQSLDRLVQQGLIRRKKILSYADVLDSSSADVEDLFSVSDYLRLFNMAYSENFPSGLSEDELPQGNRIVERINRYLRESESVRDQKHGFNHFRVAKVITTADPDCWSDLTKANFLNLLKMVHSVL